MLVVRCLASLHRLHTFKLRWQWHHLLVLFSESHGTEMALTNFSAGLLPKKKKPPSLVSLCIGVIGRHLEDIVADLGEIAVNLPADIKVAL